MLADPNTSALLPSLEPLPKQSGGTELEPHNGRVLGGEAIGESP
jgi:hypothetical protein